MDLFTWLLQGITTLIFFGLGTVKVITKTELLKVKLGDWVEEYKPTTIRVIGTLEILGSAGLIYPFWLNIYPILTLISAFGLGLVMLFAIKLHINRNEKYVFPLILLLMNIGIVILRFNDIFELNLMNLKLSIILLFVALSCAKSDAIDYRDEKEVSTGTKDFIWIDNSRLDPNYGGERILNARVWYPAESRKSSNYTPYYLFINEYEKEFNRDYYQSLKKIKTKSLPDLVLLRSENKYPLIVFSPMLGGNLSEYTWYAEMLAESGYIVLGINHLYESNYVISEPGKIIPSNHSYHDSLKALDIPSEITAKDYRKKKGVRQHLLGQDVIFGINELLTDPFFKDDIDPNTIGVFGHSIGGAAVIYASMKDSRIKAVIDLDGTPPSIALQNGIDSPFLFIEDLTDYENHRGYEILHERRNSFCELNTKESWRILIGNANHQSFLDTNYHLTDDKSEKQNSLIFLNQTSTYIKTFFDHHLKYHKLELHSLSTDDLEIIQFKK